MEIAATPNPVLDTYYATLRNYTDLGVTHEQGVRNAFRSLLEVYAKPAGWTLVEEHTLPNSRKRPDGTLLDSFRIPRGYWEAKDTQDDLDAEIRSKIKLGYDLGNTIFEDTRRAVLYQNKQRVLEADLTQRDALAGLLTRYFNHTPAEIEEFHHAEATFRQQIPSLAKGLTEIIEKARQDNPVFVAAFSAFTDLCRTSLNPNVTAGQIQEMLVQHLLTERLFRNVFDNPEFTRRNVIAAEIEKVITALTSLSFSREAYLKQLDYFYTTIENTARTITDFSEKQGFLNTIYERFFQDFSTATADTHGIVYTPQPIVDFMCESVEEVLKSEFGTSLSAEGVTILDPCTGTGNFLVNLLRRISPRDLERKYRRELFANEVMLLPYYVASLNIEHAYFDLQRRYETFPGLCFTDTLDLAQGKQLAMFAEANTDRVQKEQDAAITVIIGNPPYNVGQQNENDNNKNRKYPIVDGRIRETYAKDSKATNKNALNDAYVKFFRWASDRLGGQDGVVCFVTNNSFVDQIAFDGMRKNLLDDFDQIYHLDMHGNVRKNPKLSGTTHNVFGIQVGVGITIAIRKAGTKKFLKYHRVAEDLTKLSKMSNLRGWTSLIEVPWIDLEPNTKNAWITEGLQADFENFLPIGSKETKTQQNLEVKAIFKNYSNGVKTNRDEWVLGFSKEELSKRTQCSIRAYNSEVDRWKHLGDKRIDIDQFVSYDDPDLKWSRDLKTDLQRGRYAEYSAAKIRRSIYRPFSKQYLFFDRVMNEEVYTMPSCLPTQESEADNKLLCVSGIGSSKPFQILMSDTIPGFDMLEKTQCFPLYTYALDGKIRRDNVTDWALAQFQAQYGPDVTKQDIFHYVYGLLHSPEYRERYKENLKRELPRIPLVGGAGEGQDSPLRRFVAAGEALAALHVGYEQAEEYPLKQIVNKDVPFSWRVTKMRLNKDKTAVVVNEALTLAGIPPEAFGYKLGNRSALEWVLDQYQVSTDKRSGIETDPNRADDPEYIVRLVRRVVTVSIETIRVIESLPPLLPPLPPAE